MAKRYGLRQRTAAWMLLLVFVPMVLCSALHTHPEEEAAGAACDACVHHVRHAGHLSVASHAHECLLCQFLTLSFLPFAAALLLLPRPLASVRRAVWQAPLLRRGQAAQSSRAPPFVLIFD